MIRPAIPQDEPDLMALAKETGMFNQGELEALAGMVAEYFAGTLGDDHFWVIDDDSGLQSAAYYARETMAHGVWNLYFIGVRQAGRRQGRAGALLRHVERALQERGARLLIVETSGFDAFEPARRLYRQNGYDEEARIREFYDTGEDKIIFRKKLGPEPAPFRPDTSA